MSATGSVKLDCPPLLDKYARNGGLSLKCKSQLSGKEYQLAFIFFWLCLGLHQLAPCLDKLPDLLGLISSDYFAKVHSYLVEATGSP